MMIIPWIYFLKEHEQLLVEGFTRRWTVDGPKAVWVHPWQRANRRKGITLGPTEYLRVRDILSGEIRNEIGPQLYFSKADEEIGKQLPAIPLKDNQYVRLMDNRTGVIRVERGEASVYPEPTEKILDGGVQDGINIDEHTAVLVRDTGSGQLALVTEPQVFIPLPNQEIVEVRERIRLEDHETVVIKDKHGRYAFRRGGEEERAFFLDPYAEMVAFRWSTGIHKDERALRVTRIDSRPKFMWYEFEARTQDNVELVLGITFFWRIVGVEAMVSVTDDTPGDICSHARSAIIQSVSQVTLEQFLAAFNGVVHAAVIEADDPFYAERGVVLHAVEVRSIECKDAETQSILQEIIRETTDRINRLQKQESENEVKLRQLQGEIEAEEMKGQLLEIRRENVQAAARMEGEAEAVRVQAFFDGLGSGLSPADKVALFNTLRKQEAIEALSTGTAQLYFTPADVDLSIETK
jgi:regulator of protease activity HflC (stomatin/prohibitin superfamily)